MKKLFFIFLLGLISLSSNASIQSSSPEIYFEKLGLSYNKVFVGEQITIPFIMHYSHLKGDQLWEFTSNVTIQNLTPYSCPPVSNVPVDLKGGHCLFNLTVYGDKVGNLIKGNYFLYNNYRWKVYSLDFLVLVIPHPLSLANIPSLNATANVPVDIDLSAFVNYYSENLNAGVAPKPTLAPVQQDGLYLDEKRVALVGTPTRTGTYQFSFAIENSLGQAMPTTLSIEVGVNRQDKPIFKTNYPVASGIAGQSYSLNLISLLEAQEKFTESNPVRFRIDQNESHPDWLKLSENGKFLIGKIPLEEAGLSKKVTLIASSNTGGDSEPLKIAIPIASDPASKPVINPFFLIKAADTEFEYDVRKHIHDPANDESLQLVIDEVKPKAPWLRVSSSNITALIATVPRGSTGQMYELILHANTRTGGNSDAIKVSLKIEEDENKKPRFKAANPQLPLLIRGTLFVHDFVANNDIYPDYEEVPYTVELAAGYPNPPWLRIEDNKLIADVSDIEISEKEQVFLTIKNIPGGKSEVINLKIYVMN